LPWIGWPEHFLCLTNYVHGNGNGNLLFMAAELVLVNMISDFVGFPFFVWLSGTMYLFPEVAMFTSMAGC